MISRLDLQGLRDNLTLDLLKSCMSKNRRITTQRAQESGEEKKALSSHILGLKELELITSMLKIITSWGGEIRTW